MLNQQRTKTPQAQVIGQRLFPTIACWFGPEYAPKLTGMLLGLGEASLVPLLGDAEGLRRAAGEALAALLAASGEGEGGGE